MIDGNLASRRALARGFLADICVVKFRKKSVAQQMFKRKNNEQNRWKPIPKKIFLEFLA